MKRWHALFVLVLSLFVLLSGCGMKQSETQDYSKFIQAKPRSILILPPINNTTEVQAGSSFLSWSSKPLAELGYYVVPVALVAQTFRMNGLTEPFDIHAVSQKKLREIFGADTAMYITVEEYGTSFVLISSVTRVRATARLVDLRTGVELWSGEAHHEDSGGNSSGGGLLGMVLTAALDQVLNTTTDRAHREVAPIAAWRLFTRGGVYPGPYMPVEEKKQADASL